MTSGIRTECSALHILENLGGYEPFNRLGTVRCATFSAPALARCNVNRLELFFLATVQPNSVTVSPIPPPVPSENESIGVIKHAAPFTTHHRRPRLVDDYPLLC